MRDDLRRWLHKHIVVHATAVQGWFLLSFHCIRLASLLICIWCVWYVWSVGRVFWSSVYEVDFIRQASTFIIGFSNWCLLCLRLPLTHCDRDVVLANTWTQYYAVHSLVHDSELLKFVGWASICNHFSNSSTSISSSSSRSWRVRPRAFYATRIFHVYAKIFEPITNVGNFIFGSVC